jgi:hypothetical protein
MHTSGPQSIPSVPSYGYPCSLGGSTCDLLFLYWEDRSQCRVGLHFLYWEDLSQCIIDWTRDSPPTAITSTRAQQGPENRAPISFTLRLAQWEAHTPKQKRSVTESPRHIKVPKIKTQALHTCNLVQFWLHAHSLGSWMVGHWCRPPPECSLHLPKKTCAQNLRYTTPNTPHKCSFYVAFSYI